MLEREAVLQLTTEIRSGLSVPILQLNDQYIYNVLSGLTSGFDLDNKLNKLREAREKLLSRKNVVVLLQANEHDGMGDQVTDAGVMPSLASHLGTEKKVYGVVLTPLLSLLQNGKNYQFTDIIPDDIIDNPQDTFWIRICPYNPENEIVLRKLLMQGVTGDRAHNFDGLQFTSNMFLPEKILGTKKSNFIAINSDFKQNVTSIDNNVSFTDSRNLFVLGMLGIFPEPEDLRNKIFQDKDEILKKNPVYDLLIIPDTAYDEGFLSSPRRSFKSLPPESWKTLFMNLPLHARTCVLGVLMGTSHREYCQTVLELAETYAKARGWVVKEVKKDNLSDAVDQMLRSRVILGMDTGPMHILQALAGEKTTLLQVFNGDLTMFRGIDSFFEFGIRNRKKGETKVLVAKGLGRNETLTQMNPYTLVDFVTPYI